MAGTSKNHMREYETIFLLKNELDDASAIEFLGKMKTLVEKNGGKHLKITNWGRKKIAWERDRAQKAMFVHHLYLGNSGLVSEYERNLGIAEQCILRQTRVLNKLVDATSRSAEEDVMAPPAQKEREPRREARGDKRYGDRKEGGGYGDRKEGGYGGGYDGGYERKERTPEASGS